MKAINNIPVETESGTKPSVITSFFAHLIAYTFLLGVFLATLAFSVTMFTILLRGIIGR